MLQFTRKLVLTGPRRPYRNWGVELFCATDDDRKLFIRLLRTSLVLRDAGGFFQSGAQEGDWLLIEFWVGDQDKIITAAQLIAKELKMELELDP